MNKKVLGGARLKKSWTEEDEDRVQNEGTNWLEVRIAEEKAQRAHATRQRAAKRAERQLAPEDILWPKGSLIIIRAAD